MSNPPSPPKPPEKRRHRRYRIAVGVTLRVAGGAPAAMQGLLQEISEGGMSAFVVDGQLALDDTVDLDLALLGVHLRFQAVVRHQTGRHFRFEFLALTPEQTQKIKDCIDKLQPFMNKVMSAGPRTAK